VASKSVDVPPIPEQGEATHPPSTGPGLDTRAILTSIGPGLACGAALLVHQFVPNRQTRDFDPFQDWLVGYPTFLGSMLPVMLALAAAQCFVRPLRAAWQHYAPLLSGAFVILLCWELATSKLDWMDRFFFPGPDRVFASLIKNRTVLLESTAYSLLLLLSGYLLGVLLGVLTGVLIGWYRNVRYWGMPVLKLVGPIPAAALIPLAMTFSNDSFVSATALIAFTVWFPVTMLTSSGIANVRLAHLEVARTLGAGEWFLVYRVAIPSALPSIFVGLFMGLGASFLTLFAAEAMGVKAGLGWYVNNEKGSMEYASMYAALIVMAVLFSGLMTLLFKVRDGMLRWQQGVIKW
jgi:NitT/TauT family transport system permease protein